MCFIDTIEEQVRAYSGPQFQVTQDVMNRFAEAIEKAGVNVVPQVVVGGGSSNGAASGGNLMEGLLAMLLSERMGVQVNSGSGNPSRPEIAAMRDQIMQRLMAEQKIDAVFMEGTASCFYFANMRWGQSERTFGVVIPAKGDLAYVCPKFEEERARELIKFGNDVRTWEEHESPYKLIVQIVRDRGVQHRRIGIEERVRFFIADGVQTVAAGALRGLNDTRLPLVFAAISFWAIGFASCYWLAFPMRLGALGVWIGLSLGLAIYAVLLIWRFHVLSARGYLPEVAGA